MKEVVRFNKNNRRSSGFSVWCRDCFKKYRTAHKESYAEYHKKYYLKNKEHMLAVGKQWKEANREKRKQDWRNYYLKNKEKIYATHRQWRKQNSEKVLAWVLRWNANHPENKKLRDAKWRANHPEYFEANRERHRMLCQLWQTNNPDKHNAKQAKRRATKISATPSWANMEAIEKFYSEAARLTQTTGIKYVVDHIIPLQGQKYGVCGLHVENNLRVLPEIENFKKGNKHFPNVYQGGI